VGLGASQRASKHGHEVRAFVDLLPWLLMLSRDEVMTIVARETEFSAFSMCSTQQGYQVRIGEAVDVVRKILPELLRDSGGRGGGAFEDAQDILDSLHRACEGLRRKGKRRAE